MEYRRITSTSDWRELWLNKFMAELKNRQLSELEQKAYYSTLEKFLEKNPGNPREIDIDKTIKFIASQKTDVTPPLVLFFGAVAFSEKHLSAIAGMKKKKPAKKD
jgi:hypothetical protein